MRAFKHGQPALEELWVLCGGWGRANERGRHARCALQSAELVGVCGERALCTRWDGMGWHGMGMCSGGERGQGAGQVNGVVYGRAGDGQGPKEGRRLNGATHT